YISLVSQIAIPIGLCTVLQGLRGLQASDIWLAVVLGHVTRAALSFVRFRQGKWRRIVVDLGTSEAPVRPLERIAASSGSELGHDLTGKPRRNDATEISGSQTSGKARPES